MQDALNRIVDFILGNIGIVIFLAFLASGFLGRGNKKQQPNAPANHQGKSFGELFEEMLGGHGTDHAPGQPAQTEGRRSTSSRNVQENYPELFGSSSIFDTDFSSEKTRFGFDESEWGSTFEKNEEQWGNSFGDKKSSEPIIEWPR